MTALRILRNPFLHRSPAPPPPPMPEASIAVVPPPSAPLWPKADAIIALLLSSPSSSESVSLATKLLLLSFTAPPNNAVLSAAPSHSNLTPPKADNPVLRERSASGTTTLRATDEPSCVGLLPGNAAFPASVEGKKKAPEHRRRQATTNALRVAAGCLAAQRLLVMLLAAVS